MRTELEVQIELAARIDSVAPTESETSIEPLSCIAPELGVNIEV